MPLKAEKMVESIKAQLKKEHPKWNANKISSYAYGAVQSYYKKKGLPLPFK